MAKLTVPGCPAEALTLVVPSCSQLDPGSCETVKLAAAVVLTATRKLPLELPGAEPAGAVNWAPAGASTIVGTCAISSVIGSEALPPELVISTVVRKKAGVSSEGLTVTLTDAESPPPIVAGAPLTEHHAAAQLIDPIPSDPPPVF